MFDIVFALLISIDNHVDVRDDLLVMFAMWVTKMMKKGYGGIECWETLLNLFHFFNSCNSFLWIRFSVEMKGINAWK